VLILDEPTSGLDPNQIIEIRNVIKEQGKNKTVLFSSHILQEVQAICERVIIINKGQIVADDKLSNMQQHEQGNAVKVSFREIINKEILSALQNVMNVAAENDYTWKLFTQDAAQVKKQLLVFALEKNLNIVSLETQGNQLEDIFRALTAE